MLPRHEPRGTNNTEASQFKSVLRPGSAQLTDVFEREVTGANDTSVGVGYAPLTETERLVLTAEKTINGPAFKERFPEAGEDVKVMGVRVGRGLELTLAIAIVDRFVPDERAYFRSKAVMREHLLEVLRAQLSDLDSVEIVVNALDREGRGTEGMYLTVTGTCAEGADSGEVGRGNRVNGLISFGRPQSLEAAAGKNPVSHVGKIYNLFAHHMAEKVQSEVEGLTETQVFLCSRIGSPVTEPWIASVQIGLDTGAGVRDVEPAVRSVCERELVALPEFIRRIVAGQLPIC